MELKKYKLGEIIDCFIPGDWGEDAPTAEAQSGVYCIRGADIVPISHGNYNNVPKRYIGSRSMATRLLQSGDLIVEKSGGSPTQSTGRIVYVSKDLIEAKGNVVCSNFCTAFRVKPEWNPLYVYYFWHNVYNSGAFFNFEGKTSGLKNLQLDNALASIEIEYIHLEQQNEIVSVLSSIEKKIALNRQINDNLESMAKQLYDYWFVQFDFPNEEGKPYKSSGGKMVWNEKLKREIPDCFDAIKMGELCNFRNGINYAKDEIGNEYKIVNVRNISSSRILLNGEEFDTITVPKAKAENYMLKSDDIIIARSGCPGATRILLSPTNTLFCGFIICCTPNDNRMRNYLTYCLKQVEGTSATISGGSILQNVSQDTLKALPIVIPTKTVLTRFNETIELIFARMLKCLMENRSLTKQRDELLPLLMNGQTSVNAD